jgi:hypothetical protein
MTINGIKKRTKKKTLCIKLYKYKLNITIVLKIFKHNPLYFLMENKIIYKCDNCSKKYKTKSSLDKHNIKCKKPEVETDDSAAPQNNITKENNYDVNMTFLEGNKVQVEVKKQGEDGKEEAGSGEDEEDGEKVLKDLIKPKVSESYQEEIDKLDDLITMFKDFPVSTNKDATINQLKNIITILMSQSQNLIKEMQTMSKRNSYYKNNIMLAAFVLDKCRKEIPDNDEEFDNMFV